MLLGCSSTPDNAGVSVTSPSDAGSLDSGIVVSADGAMTDGPSGFPVAADAGQGDGAARDASAVDAAPAVRFVGRMDNSTPGEPKFEWEGSAIEANFSGTQLAVTIAGDPATPNYFAVVIDGAAQPTLVVNGATPTRYPLATSLASGPHHVLLVRRDEAFQNTTQFVSFDVGPSGQLLAPPPAPARRIEFIGDSITAGYGVECTNASMGFTAATENEYIAYGSIAARDLGAEAHIIAWSGEGVYRNYGAAPDAGTLMPAYWRLTRPTVPGNAWDFSSWTPDVVVVNLGTNDFSTTPPADIDAQYQAAYLAFLQQIHATYPSAYVFCALGPMLADPHLSEARTAIKSAIGAMQAGGLSRIALVEFPPQSCGTDGSGCGCDGHPNPATHEQMATLLESAIRPALGW
jgi:lysophospholipase L1-like esterase